MESSINEDTEISKAMLELLTGVARVAEDRLLGSTKVLVTAVVQVDTKDKTAVEVHRVELTNLDE